MDDLMASNFQEIIDNQVELSWTPPHGFYMVINGYEDLMFTLQRVQIPVISGEDVLQSSAVNPGKTMIPGTGLEYSVLSCDFILDKHFKTYRTILDWMKSNYAPEDLKGQWINWMNTMKDVTVIGTDAANVPLVEWHFKDAFPISVDGPMFDATMPDIEYLTSNVTFKFKYFTNKTYTNGIPDDNII